MWITSCDSPILICLFQDARLFSGTGCLSSSEKITRNVKLLADVLEEQLMKADLPFLNQFESALLSLLGIFSI